MAMELSLFSKNVKEAHSEKVETCNLLFSQLSYKPLWSKEPVLSVQITNLNINTSATAEGFPKNS